MHLHTLSRAALPTLALSLLVACPAHKLPGLPPGDPSAPCGQAEAVSSTEATVQGYISAAKAVPGEYIVVLKPSAPGTMEVQAAVAAQNLTAQYGGNVFFVYERALRGFASRMSKAQAQVMARAPEVAYIEENAILSIREDQGDATWGIDRIDQRDLPLNKQYQYRATGKGVHAYIIDTGIRITHTEFGGRAHYGFDAMDDGQKGNDCHGHGTHVAATVGGGVYGVAKGVRLHAVRVLDCAGSGTTAGVIAGVDWVTENRELPAVANMSLGGGASPSIDDAVRRSIAAGITYVVAAGNENQDACRRSPARTREAITVGSTTDSDRRSTFSNWGSCVDVFAPGSDITSAWIGDDTATRSLSGTSMASPHVAGVVALYLEGDPTAQPAAVATALIENSTSDKVANPGTCSSNRLTYSTFATPPRRPTASPSTP